MAEIGGIELIEPLNIADLLSNGGHFQISNEDPTLGSEMYEDFGAGSDEEDIDELEIDTKNILSPWENDFGELKKEMIEIESGIWKKTVRNGVQKFGLVPKQRARVTIQYSSYKEKDTKPVDSTFLRGKYQVFTTGTFEVLTGLEEAICTMYKGEISHFLISYKLLFGVIGCPPRIPERCDLLYVIEIKDFCAVGDLNAVEEISPEDRNKFSIILPKVREVHLKGKDFFSLKNYEHAKHAFHKAVYYLESCRLANEVEEKEHKKFLKVLYSNLAVCYLKKSQPKKVCSMCNELRKLDSQAFDKNAKALYCEGRAVLMLGDFIRAKRSLLKAQRAQPANPEIADALSELATRKKNHDEFEREMSERLTGVLKLANKPEDKKLQNLKQTIKETLQKFMDDPNSKEISFPEGLLKSEEAIVEIMAKDMNLKVRTTLRDEKFIVKN